MADQAVPDDPAAAGKSPVLMQVTIEARPGGRPAARRIRLLGRFAPVVAGVAIVLLAGAVVGVVVNRNSKPAQPIVHAQAAQAANPGPVGLAAAYRYPLACLSVTIPTTDPTWAAVRLNRASPCWRIGVYSTVIFRRVGGWWRMLLEIPSASCLHTSIPSAVRVELGLC
jgi:hypothetical protein